MKKYTILLSLFAWSVIILYSGCSKSSPEPSPSDPRQPFLGRWGVTETSTKNYYTATITADASTSDGVFISNFAASGSTVQTHAVVSGNTITVNSQQLSNGWIVNGSGTYASGKITWPYSINDGANLTNYISVFTKL